MATIFLGDNLISYEESRSHLSRRAREAAYFEQFRPEDLREIRVAPTLAILVTALIGGLWLASYFRDGISDHGVDASLRHAANTETFRQPGRADRVSQRNESDPTDVEWRPDELADCENAGLMNGG
jgi:hypothetical protein